MHCLPAMQRVQRTQYRRDLSANISLGLRAMLIEPRAEVAVFRVLDDEAIAHVIAIHFGEAIENAKRSFLSREQLGEIRFAKPTRQTVRDLDAHSSRKTRCWFRRGEINFAETASADQSVETIGPVRFRTVRSLCDQFRAWSALGPRSQSRVPSLRARPSALCGQVITLT